MSVVDSEPSDSGFLSSREVLGPAVGAESQSSKENTSFTSTGDAELRNKVGYSPHHQQLSTARDHKILKKNLSVAKQLLKDLIQRLVAKETDMPLQLDADALQRELAEKEKDLQLAAQIGQVE